MDKDHEPLQPRCDDLMRFLAALRDVPNITRACRIISREPGYIRDWRKRDPAFDKAVTEALDDGIDSLEAEVHRRAFEGIDKPIVYQGQVTDTYKDFSDNLAQFLLKAHRPEKYRERSEVQSTGSSTVTIVTGVPRGPTADDLI